VAPARPVGGQRAAPATKGGDDVRGVTVEGLAGPVVTHRRAGVGVTGRVLYVAEWDAGVQAGGNQVVPQAVG
jgi:hypothetical protein